MDGYEIEQETQSPQSAESDYPQITQMTRMEVEDVQTITKETKEFLRSLRYLLFNFLSVSVSICVIRGPFSSVLCVLGAFGSMSSAESKGIDFVPRSGYVGSRDRALHRKRIGAMNTLRRIGRGRGGVTLVELMVVILLMAILGGIVLGVTGYAGRKGARARAFAEIEQLKNALEKYRLKQGAYPDTALPGAQPATTVLLVLTNEASDIVFTDPWGRPYMYEKQGRYIFRLWSYGPDTNNIETRVEKL